MGVNASICRECRTPELLHQVVFSFEDRLKDHVCVTFILMFITELSTSVYTEVRNLYVQKCHG